MPDEIICSTWVVVTTSSNVPNPHSGLLTESKCVKPLHIIAASAVSDLPFDSSTLKLPGSPPKDTCPGRVDSVAFNDAGDRAFALEVCDGSLITLDVAFDAGAGVPLSGASLSVGASLALVAPLSVDTLGQTRQPSELRVRPGIPGVDFEGPDVFFLVGEPEGLLCGIRIESL